MSGSWLWWAPSRRRPTKAGFGDGAQCPRPVCLRPVSRRSRVSLPNRDASDSRAFGHRVHLPSGFVIEILREIFGRRINRVERRLFIQEFMVHLADNVADHALQMSEIVKQSDGIELRPFQRDSHLIIMPVHVFALSLVPAQGVP